MNTLEYEVETAYQSVLRTYQTELAEVRIDTVATGLDQVPADAEEDGEYQVYKKLPCITLRAERGEETFRNACAFAVTLNIEVEAVAQQDDTNGMVLDELFALAIRPLAYKEFVEVMGTANRNLRMYGINRRFESFSQQPSDASFMRTATVVLQCAQVTIA